MTDLVHSLITDETLADLGCDLLRIPSFKGHETDLAIWLADWFSARDYDVTVQEVEPGRMQTFARLPGHSGGKSLMLNGHLDIDPLQSGWKRDPFEPTVQDGRLYGAGARNMKAGLTSMIVAAEAIRRSGMQLSGDLTLACVAGELQGGVGTTYALRNGLTADAAIVPEPFDSHNLVTTTCGVLELAVTTRGFSQHISRKEKSVDAVSMMMPVIHALNRIDFRHDPHPGLPGLPRLLVGGLIAGRGDGHDMSGPNYTPDRCTATLDIRYVPGQTRESVLADVRRAIDSVLDQVPALDYEITFDSRAPYVLNQVVFEPSELPVDDPFVALVSQVYEDRHGEPPREVGAVLPHSYCGADSAHLWRAGIPAVLLGPTGPAPTPDEPDDCVFIEQMSSVSHVLAETAVRFCNGAPQKVTS